MIRTRGGDLVIRSLALGSVCLALGCTGRLPGPIECERMATKLVGVDPGAPPSGPEKQRLVGIVTQGCLTTPFDHQAVRCVEESGSLPRCMEQFVWRAPERKPALERFMHRALGIEP